MKIRTIEDVENLKKAVNRCSRAVWLEAADGRHYNLSDGLGQYAGIGALLQDQDEELELFASDYDDELIMMDFLSKLCA